jgi:hypothetical protein
MKKPKSDLKINKESIDIHAADKAAFTHDFAETEFQATLTESLACRKNFRESIDPKCLRKEITRACDEVNAGNMRLPERMAMAQAHTLDALFHRLAQRAIENFGAHWFEPYMKLALRAQAQSARTLETLAALKNPTIFARQLNVANQQVVNNGTAPLEVNTPTRALLSEPRPIVPLAKIEIFTPAHESHCQMRS